MTVAELRTKAKAMGITGYSRMNKEELIMATTPVVTDMNYVEFKNRVQVEILDFLPDEYADSKVSITKVNKNNEILDGLTIVKADSQISPTIYLNSFYEEYSNGVPFNQVCNKIARARMEHDISMNSIGVDMNTITDWLKAKEVIEPRVFSERSGFISERPHVEFADDLIITFCVPLGENENGAMTVPVTNSLMNSWKVNVDEIYKAAMENVHDITFMGMNEVMAEMMMPQFIEMAGGDEELARQMLEEMVPPEDKMFVLSNKSKLNGAVGLLDNEMLEKVKERVGDNFYIGDLVCKLKGERSIRQMSRDTGVAASYISMMMKDKYTPSLEIVCKLCKYSNCKTVTILDFVSRIYQEV